MLDIISHRKPAHDHVSVANGLNLDKQVGKIMKKRNCNHLVNIVGIYDGVKAGVEVIEEVHHLHMIADESW